MGNDNFYTGSKLTGNNFSEKILKKMKCIQKSDKIDLSHFVENKTIQVVEKKDK